MDTERQEAGRLHARARGPGPATTAQAPRGAILSPNPPGAVSWGNLARAVNALPAGAACARD
ncbi:hypothetical protein AAHH79_33850, partial [Burkholderia pseudomallei]